MDNDDNDYQGAGLHLVGEESSKVSPVLRPFTLPKFDFDVGQIRFDNLVENEVFLGIPSQEDNQWIEEFSRGSSGLEFSSGAADSCSIPRHINVWSEATSSETVEMLLKSVGQEEMIPGEPPIQDSDGGDELPNLTKKMDDKIDNMNDANSPVPPVEALVESSGTNQNPDVGDGRGKCLSEVQEVDLQAYGPPGASNEKVSQVVTEVNTQLEMSYDDNPKEGSTLVKEVQQVDLSTDGPPGSSNEKVSQVVTEVNMQLEMSHTENSKGGCTLVNESLSDRIQDDPSVTEVKVPDPEGLVQDATPIIEKTNDQILVSDVCHENAIALTDDSIVNHGAQDNLSVNGEKLNDSSAQTCSNDLHPLLQDASSVETLGKCAAEFATSNSDSSSLAPAGNSDLQTWEGPSEEGSLVDKEDDNPGITHQKGRVSSVTHVESTMLCGLQIESSQQVGQAITQEDDPSVVKQSSVSGGDDCGVITQGLEDVNDNTAIHREQTSAPDLVLAHAEADSADVVGEFSSSQHVHIHDYGGHGVLIHEKVAEDRPSSDTGELEHDSVGPLNGGRMVGTSSAEVAEENVESIETIHGSELDASNKNGRESNFELEDTGNISPKTVENCPPVDSAAAEVLCNIMEQKSDQSEGNREMQIEVLTDAKMSSLQISADEAFQQVHDFGAQVVASDSNTVEVVPEVANQSAANLVLAETSDAANNVEQEVDRASAEPSDKIELSSVLSEPIAKMNEGVEAVEIHKHEEPPSEVNNISASSGAIGGAISAEIYKPNAMSEEVDGGTSLSRSDMDEQAGVKGGKVENLLSSNSKESVAGNNSLDSMPPRVNAAPEEEKSFTFDVSPLAGLPEEGTNRGRQSISQIKAQKRSRVLDGSPLTSGSSQKDPKVIPEISHGSLQTPGKGVSPGASKGSSERKTRRGSAKPWKENARKGNSKETVPLRQAEIGDKVSVSVGSSGGGQLMQLDVGSVERLGAKTGMVVSVPGSSLPDLNTSAPISLLFQQPFTDLQQVQLRAQIFVYGSLIQGVAPDEACMISAFGMSDGASSLWEPTWRACLERLHGQKSHPSSSETPLQSRSSSKALDQSNKQGSSQSKVVSTPAGRLSSKITPSPIVNPMIPLSSPLWNISTPSCDTLLPGNLVRGAVLDYPALSPLHPYQTPTVRNLAGHTSSWPSQAPFPGSWVSSAQNSAVDTRFSSQPVTETLKLAPIMESSVAVSSTVKHASPNPTAPGGSSSVFSATSSLPDVTRASANAQQSTEKKSRKRKKAFVTEDLGQIPVSVALTGTVSMPVITSDASKKAHVVDVVNQGVMVGQSDTVVSHLPITSYFSTSVAVATPSNIVLKSSSDKSLAVTPASSIDHSKVGNSTSEKRLLKAEDVAKVEEAKLQAEEAAGHAAIAVTHCQNVWCQLDKHKNSGLMSDVEAKVVSAAAAIATSASIAKAAAAAAKIAANVALQAKLMVDEALISSGTQNSTQADFVSLPSFVNMGNATPASILKVGEGNSGSSSIIFAAREAAKKKLEAASAASRHAENCEAIVKAAELAAEAVSQAGKVVAMGDPMPIAKLVEAGPEGYLKCSEFPSVQGAKSNNILGNISNINRVQEVSDAIMEPSERPLDKDLHAKDQVTLSLPKEISKNSVEDEQKQGNDTVSAPVTRGEKDLRGQRNRRPSDLSKHSDVVAESETPLRSTAYESVAGNLNDSGGIKEGCLVEVFKDNGNFTGAWFSANVLSLEGGKASVCYTELESAEGSGKLEEWVPLGAEGSKPPRIRLAHPMTSLSFEGARKRRRADARNHTWSIGDRVDAWIENGWREGVVLEKNKKDESTLSVHFPAQGKTSVVRAWHLRPTLVWKDGDWIEWSNFRESLKGDTPQEKRLKLGSPPVEGKEKGKLAKSTDISETGKIEEPRLLPLSGNEKIFNMGSTRNENKPEALRTMRSGLQKEGSKVIFGVPKPGKKRKFMEVSKHYISDHNSKNNAHNDSDKFNKFMMPQGTGSRAWRNNSKVESKEKQAADSNRLKGLKSGRHPNLSSRALPQKDNSVISSVSSLKDTTLPDNSTKDQTSNDDNGSSQQNATELVSTSNNEEAAEEETSLSSHAIHSDAPKKALKTNAKSERLRRGRLAPTAGKLTKVEVKDKTIPEAVEPRRSNRRIQPTSRLLEGLQSSLVISKYPPVSHDKNQKNLNRGISRGNN